jgi:hypothetical protein
VFDLEIKGLWDFRGAFNRHGRRSCVNSLRASSPSSVVAAWVKCTVPMI